MSSFLLCLIKEQDGGGKVKRVRWLRLRAARNCHSARSSQLGRVNSCKTDCCGFINPLLEVSGVICSVRPNRCQMVSVKNGMTVAKIESCFVVGIKLHKDIKKNVHSPCDGEGGV